jgi:phospholipid/cholesterol/gamma-HCH transport system substrate-binding protein
VKIPRELLVGLFVAISIVLVLVGISYLQGRSVIGRSMVMSAVYKDVDGLKSGDKVLLNGYQVGSIKEVVFSAQTREMEVFFDVDKEIQVPVDSKAMIADMDFFGSKCIRLDLGKSSEYAAHKSRIQSGEEAGVMAGMLNEIQPIKVKMDSLLTDLTVISAAVRKTVQDSANRTNRIAKNVEITTANVAQLSQSFKTTLVKVNNLTDSVNHVVQHYAQHPDIKAMLKNSKTFSDTLAATAGTLRRLVQQTEASSQTIKVMLDKVNKGEGSLGMMMNDKALYSNMNRTAADLDSLLIDLRKNPKRYVQFSLIQRKEKKQ